MNLQTAQRHLARAIIRGELPETALDASIIEASRPVRVFGGGESGTWRRSLLVSVDGKRVSTDRFHLGGSFETLADEVAAIVGVPVRQFAQVRHVTLYVPADFSRITS